MKKNILFISPTGTLDNGAEISIVHLMTYLVQIGYKVVTALPDYGVPIQQGYVQTLTKAGIEALPLPAVKWWWKDAPGGLPGTEAERDRSYQENVQALRQLIREKEINLVISNTANVFQGAVAAACESIPHFWLIHEFPEGEFGYYKDKLDFISDYSDEIFTVRGALQESLTALLPERTILSFAPFTQISLAEKQAEDHAQRRLVSVGRLTERKNQLELIQAYAGLAEPRPDLVFIGAWDEDYKKKCDAYIAEQQLKNIDFLGLRENPWAEVTAADLAVFPSAMETFGLVYIESILKGIPTILSDNPGHRSAYDIFEEGILYPSGQVSVLTATIEQALADFDDLKKQALTNLEQTRGRYTIEQVYQEILDKIESVDCQKQRSLRHVKFLLEPLAGGQASSFLGKVKRKVSSLLKKS